jgi:hypothetical protein
VAVEISPRFCFELTIVARSITLSRIEGKMGRILPRGNCFVIRLAVVALAFVAVSSGQNSNAQVVEVGSVFSSTPVPLPADHTMTGNGLITGELGSNELPFDYAIHLTLRGAYDDNIALTHTNRLDDWFAEIHPGLTLGFGDVKNQTTFLALAYMPSFFRYDDHPDFNNDAHIVNVLGGYKNDDVSIRVSQDIGIFKNIVLAGTTAERSNVGAANGRTDLEVYNTRANANINVTKDDFIFAEYKMYLVEYDQPLVSSELYAADVYVNHSFSRQFVLGVGMQGGYDQVDFPTPNQTMVQTNAHLNWTPGNQFTIDIIAGEEFRSFENDARGPYTTPVLSMSAIYSPNEATRIVFGASRQIYNSAAATAQDYVDTTASGSIREHVCKPLYLGVSAGYEHVNYFNASSASPFITISDDYFYVQPSADIVLTRFWSIGGYYLRRQNDASLSSSSFYSNEAGVRTSLKF